MSPQETEDKKFELRRECLFFSLENDMIGAKDSITMVILEMGFPFIKKI